MKGSSFAFQKDITKRQLPFPCCKNLIPVGAFRSLSFLPLKNFCPSVLIRFILTRRRKEENKWFQRLWSHNGVVFKKGKLIPFFYRLLHHERASRSYFMFTSYDCFSTGRHIPLFLHSWTQRMILYLGVQKESVINENHKVSNWSKHHGL